MQRGIVLHDLDAAAMAVHVAEAANVHQYVKAKFLSGVIGAGDLVVTAAVAQSKIDNFAALRLGQSLNYFPNLPVGVMGILIEQRGGKFNFQRVGIQQIHQRSRLNLGRSQ